MALQIQELSIDSIKPYEKNPRRNDEAVKYVANSIKEFGFKIPIVVDANYVIVAAHYFIDDRKQSTVFRYDKPARNGVHPTMKPIELFEQQITNSSRQGENVFDSFGGSGTTIIACEKLGRHGYSCELDPKYCDAIVLRWQNLTGKSAMLLKDDGTKVQFSELQARKGS